jgi:hypothetical protein
VQCVLEAPCALGDDVCRAAAGTSDRHAVNRIHWAVKCGLALGLVAGALGFFLPILLTPEANQGPLLGIFVTGPLGCVVGALVGAVFAERLEARLSRRRQ